MPLYSDFEGAICETSANDCESIVCSGDGEIVDGLGICHCECIVQDRMTGPNCDKRMLIFLAFKITLGITELIKH